MNFWHGLSLRIASRSASSIACLAFVRGPINPFSRPIICSVACHVLPVLRVSVETVSHRACICRNGPAIASESFSLSLPYFSRHRLQYSWSASLNPMPRNEHSRNGFCRISDDAAAPNFLMAASTVFLGNLNPSNNWIRSIFVRCVSRCVPRILAAIPALAASHNLIPSAASAGLSISRCTASTPNLSTSASATRILMPPRSGPRHCIR